MAAKKKARRWSRTSNISVEDSLYRGERISMEIWLRNRHSTFGLTNSIKNLLLSIYAFGNCEASGRDGAPVDELKILPEECSY